MLRVLNQMGPTLDTYLERAGLTHAIEVVALAPDGVPSAADVLYGGWDANVAALAAIRDRLIPWVHIGATGVELIPRDLLASGVTFTCARGVSGTPIAEFVVASILAYAKRFPDVWVNAPANPLMITLDTLEDATVVLVGLGGIGTAVARRLLPFGTRVVAVRRTGASSDIEGVEVVTDLHAAVAEADHLVLACPLTEATRGLVDASVLAAMKPGLHLVNVARGAIVDDEALRVALDEGRVARASLDVTEPEPLPEGHWMYTHPAVHVSPHLSWSNPRQIERFHRSFVENLRAYLAGDPLPGLVDVREGY